MTRIVTNKKELLFRDETYAIIGAAMEVDNQLGSGFAEAVYQEALGMEFGLRSVPHVAQERLKLVYKSMPLSCEYIADFVCFGSIIVELKALKEIGTREEAQVINYLKATGMRLGLLINFGDPGRLDWQRFVL